jgi:hypothetical protein
LSEKEKNNSTNKESGEIHGTAKLGGITSHFATRGLNRQSKTREKS